MTLSVLFVEDDDDFAYLLERGIGPEIDLTRVSTMAEAHTALAARPYDATLLDLNLPDSVGRVDTVRQAVKLTFPTPIVVLTSTLDGDGGLAKEAKAAGAYEWVGKDARPEIVGRIVRIACACRGLVQTLTGPGAAYG